MNRRPSVRQSQKQTVYFRPVAGPSPCGEREAASCHGTSAPLLLLNHLGESMARRRRSLMREGRQYLAVGIAFLFACGVAGYFALRALPPPIGLFVDQGLLIVGWVANWKPIEIFLYDWRPLRRDESLFAALGRMEIGFGPFQAEGASQGANG